mmetsp:Transcript_13131/g.57168  ORF Transcript_13131/g.57168 Transcript_13131/m.57168 type:complete len:129 (-) Transcript_13131:2216-2602(-)
MWSVGVILFILLSGNSPFENEDEQVLFRRIRSGDYSMDDCLWDYISAGAKDCVRQLLVVDTSERMSVTEALRHPWILGIEDACKTCLPSRLLQVKKARLKDRFESFRMIQEEERLAKEHANGIDSRSR